MELYLRVRRENPKTEEGRQKIITLFNGAANDDDHDDDEKKSRRKKFREIEKQFSIMIPIL